MNRFLLTGAAALSVAGCASHPQQGVLKAAEGQRPNVILLVADDLGYGDLPCYGADSINTPVINSLAAGGLRFTNAHCVASTSTPARYGLLTGCYPFRKAGTNVAAGNAGMIIRPEQYTVADVFHDAGYATAAIGKWHLGLGDRTGEQNWNDTLDFTPRDLGFDYHYIMAATADRVPCVFIEQGRVANYDASAPITVSYRGPIGDEPLGSTHPELLTKLRPSHGHDMAIVNGISRIGYMTGGGEALWQDENIADSITAHAVEFMSSHRDEPFFLYLCTNDIHVPRYPHDRFRGKSPMGLRGDAILQFEWTAEQIVGALNDLGIADNTLLVLTSDNGPVLDDGYQDGAVELAGSHRPGGPLRGGKYSAFEAGNAVPFIVSWPGVVEPGVTDVLLSQIDCVATMAALTGVSIPEGQATDSRCALTTWLGEGTDRDFAVSMAANRSLELRTARWKYIEPSAGEPIISWGPIIETGYSLEPQLYDLANDVGEQANVAAQYPALTDSLRQVLEGVKNGK